MYRLDRALLQVPKILIRHSKLVPYFHPFNHFSLKKASYSYSKLYKHHSYFKQYHIVVVPYSFHVYRLNKYNVNTQLP